jgi:very-short-patch-repair endonuclease
MHNRRSSSVLIHRTRDLPEHDVVELHHIPVTNPTRTLIDLASVLDDEELEVALDDVLVRRLTRISRLNWRLGQFYDRHRKGLGLLKALLAARDPKSATPESALESHLLRLLRSARLPAPIPQFRVTRGRDVVARLDFAYPQAMVGIEADGYRYHGAKQRWQSDLRKRNVLAGLGWRLVVVSWKDVTERADETVQRIREALDSASEAK